MNNTIFAWKHRTFHKGPHYYNRSWYRSLCWDFRKWCFVQKINIYSFCISKLYCSKCAYSSSWLFSTPFCSLNHEKSVQQPYATTYPPPLRCRHILTLDNSLIQRRKKIPWNVNWGRKWVIDSWWTVNGQQPFVPTLFEQFAPLCIFIVGIVEMSWVFWPKIWAITRPKSRNFARINLSNSTV